MVLDKKKKQNKTKHKSQVLWKQLQIQTFQPYVLCHAEIQTLVLQASSNTDA